MCVPLAVGNCVIFKKTMLCAQVFFLVLFFVCFGFLLRYKMHMFNQEISYSMLVQFSSVQSLSCVRLFVTPWIAACQASLSITNSRSSLKLTSIGSVMPSSHLILCQSLVKFGSINYECKSNSKTETLWKTNLITFLIHFPSQSGLKLLVLVVLAFIWIKWNI